MNGLSGVYAAAAAAAGAEFSTTGTEIVAAAAAAARERLGRVVAAISTSSWLIQGLPRVLRAPNVFLVGRPLFFGMVATSGKTALDFFNTQGVSMSDGWKRQLLNQ